MNISPLAVVHPEAKIGQNTTVDPFAVIEKDVVIGDNCRIYSHATILDGARIGKDIPPYTLIGRDPIVYCGINIVGLRRRGFTNSQVFLIQDIYRTLYTRGLNNTEALKAIETEYEPSEERDLILNFIKSSQRGIVRGSIDE